MDIDQLKQCWRRDAGAEVHVALDAGSVSQWIEARAKDVNRQVKDRLHREVANYIPMVVVLSVMMLMQGISVTSVLFVAGLILAVGAILATLWYSERRLTGLLLDGSLREVLEDLLVRVDAASRAYEVAYIGVFASGMVALTLTAWWRAGFSAWFTAALIAGGLAVLWASRSGHGYVGRMFGPYRSELADCLRELDRC
jgi:uncharacterized membrane protein YecN with MAPEG domain